MAVAILEANGIRSIVSADRVGPMQPQLRFAPGIRLSVRRADAVAALELLEPE